MTETASLRVRPGNRLTRRVAGLPVAPVTGEVDIPSLPAPKIVGAIDLIAPPAVCNDLTRVILETQLMPVSIAEPSTGHLLIDAIGMPAVSPDLTAAPSETADVGFSIAPPDAVRIDFARFTPVETDGALYFKDKKLGTPGGLTDAILAPSAERRKNKHREAAESLLTRLLPILLPPARTKFSDVFVVPYDLYAFQRDGIRFLNETVPGALLADEMGLGKTVQSIMAMRHLFRGAEVQRALIVVPKSIQTTWERHLAEWAPELQILTLAGTQSQRAIQWRSFASGRAHVGIVSYQTLARDSDEASRLGLDLVVADEVQNIKNPTTQQSHALRDLPAKRRWGLSGTPLENKVEDLATILNFLDPQLLPSREPSGTDVKRAAEKIMLRRRKKQVLKDLPDIVSHIEYVSLGAKQRKAYDLAEEQGIRELEGENVSLVNVLSLITALKQICNGVAGESSKREWLDEYIETVTEQNDKTLVFSQYVKTVNEIEEPLARFSPLKFTGQLSLRERTAVVDEFQNGEEHSALLISLKAGGTGLTLTAANHVVHFDSWWNPAVMSQATARVHRIGQEKVVFEKTLVAKETVEERIQQKLDDKRELFARVVDDLSIEGLSRTLSEEEMFDLFGLKPSKPASSGNRASSGLPSPQKPPPAIAPTGVIQSETPFHNVIEIRKVIRTLKGTVWWVDPNFSRRALEELADELVLSTVTDVRIISRDLSPKDKKDFDRFRREMEGTNIIAEWRLDMDARFHDRFLAGNGACFNVPPVNSIYQQPARYSQINPSPRPPFEEWWESSKEL